MDLSTIADPPMCAFSDYIQAVMNTMPSIGWVAPFLLIKHIIKGEVSSFIDLSHQEVWVCKDPPPLLS